MHRSSDPPVSGPRRFPRARGDAPREAIRHELRLMKPAIKARRTGVPVTRRDPPRTMPSIANSSRFVRSRWKETDGLVARTLAECGANLHRHMCNDGATRERAGLAGGASV